MKLRIRESNGDKISEVISSPVVRTKLDEIRDDILNQGTYYSDGKYYPITRVTCNVTDVWDVPTKPNLVDIIGYVDIRWDIDEETDVVGTTKTFSFYYDKVNDTIIDDDDLSWN